MRGTFAPATASSGAPTMTPIAYAETSRPPCGIVAPRSPVTIGRTPIVANSVVPMPKPPSASAVMLSQAGRAGRGGAGRCGGQQRHEGSTFGRHGNRPPARRSPAATRARRQALPTRRRSPRPAASRARRADCAGDRSRRRRPRLAPVGLRAVRGRRPAPTCRPRCCSSTASGSTSAPDVLTALFGAYAARAGARAVPGRPGVRPARAQAARARRHRAGRPRVAAARRRRLLVAAAGGRPAAAGRGERRRVQRRRRLAHRPVRARARGRRRGGGRRWR